MKPRFILCLALVLSGGLFGCSTAHRDTVRQINSLPLYVYSGFEDNCSASRFLSTQIRLDEEFYVGGDDFLSLKGHVEQQGANLIVDLMMSTGQQAQFYRGNMTLEKPFFAQGGAASGGAGPPYWFVVSTNSDCRTVLEHVNAVMGYTNAPFSHPSAILPPPVISNFPKDIDPATGLPMSHDKQP